MVWGCISYPSQGIRTFSYDRSGDDPWGLFYKSFMFSFRVKPENVLPRDGDHNNLQDMGTYFNETGMGMTSRD